MKPLRIQQYAIVVELTASAAALLWELNGFRVYLEPKKPTFFKDLYKEMIIRNAKKVGYSGLR